MTYIINFSDFYSGTFTLRTWGEISISDRGLQVQRLKITIKNTTGATPQCKQSVLACCQTRNPEQPAGSTQCNVDMATHP